MKIKSILLIAAVVAFTAVSCQQGGLGKKVTLKTELDSASYALGVLIAQQNKQSLETVPGGKDINMEIMVNAFYTVLKGEKADMEATAANDVVSKFFQSMGEKVGQENLEKGNAYLEKNKARAGVVTTASGLQYEILTAGAGAKPVATDVVKVHYVGTTIDGKEFDSSVSRGEPAQFAANQVIPGWTEALQLMPVGSKWKLFIPAELGYGERGAGANIGPNSVLVFEVELLEIMPAEAQPAIPGQ